MKEIVFCIAASFNSATDGRRRIQNGNVFTVRSNHFHTVFTGGRGAQSTIFCLVQKVRSCFKRNLQPDFVQLIRPISGLSLLEVHEK